jgi:hypothetical protein
MIFDAFSEYSKDQRTLTKKQAAEFGSRGGKARKAMIEASRTPDATAKAAWFGNSHLSTQQVMALPDLDGWSQTLAYRKFGPRNRHIGAKIGRPKKPGN